MKKLTEFLRENPDISLVGFAWSCYWRLWVAILAIYLGIFVIATVLGAIFS